MSFEFKTPKGTTLPLLDLKGKRYLQVAHRLVWFREEYPHGSIKTEIIERNAKFVICRAEIVVPYGNNGFLSLATATKREDFGHFADAIEKAETGAIGRALALCGFGTQFAPEFDEEARVVDSPLPKNDFSEESLRKRQIIKQINEANRPLTSGSYVAPTQDPNANIISEPQRKRLLAIAGKVTMTHDELKNLLLKKYGIGSTNAIPWTKYEAIVGDVERFSR